MGKLRVASTFSGCGGSSYGLKQAGLDVVYASEFIPIAADTYEANFPHISVDRRDIRDVSGSDLGEFDILEGSPPCSAFSAAGKLAAGWGASKHYSSGVSQRVDDLFFELIRLAEETKPRAVLAENVPNLTRGQAKGYFQMIMNSFREIGYEPQASILDASWLGVPQARRRLIIVAFPKGSEAITRYEWPKPFGPRPTLRDAIADLETGDTIDEETGYDVSIVEHAIYKQWLELAPGEGHVKRFNLVRCHWDKPAPTILAMTNRGAAGPCHPDIPRKFKLDELRRICGFPDDYVLIGDWVKRRERLGRAVPPPVYTAVGKQLRKALEN